MREKAAFRNYVSKSEKRKKIKLKNQRILLKQEGKREKKMKEK